MNKRFIFCESNGKCYLFYLKIAKKLAIKQYGYFGFLFMPNCEKAKIYDYWFRRLYFGELIDLPKYMKY